MIIIATALIYEREVCMLYLQVGLWGEKMIKLMTVHVF